MKKSKYIFLILILFFAIVTCSAQEKWTRIEFEKTVSVAVPDSFLVDAEKNDRNRKYRVFAYNSDFQIELNVYKNDNPKVAVNYYRMESNDSDKTEIDGMAVRRLIKFQNKLQINIVLIGTKNFVYAFRVLAENINAILIQRFIDAIKINGKSPFPQQVEPIKTIETLISDSELKSSVEVVNSWNRKISKTEEYEKVTKPDNLLTKPVLDKPYSRTIIFLNDPETLMTKKVTKFIVRSDRPEIPKEPEQVLALITFLASGEIGTIKVFSTGDEDNTKSIVKSIKSIKFLPAQIDGKNVSSQTLLSFSEFKNQITTKIIW
jgi:hypothetical protein